MGQYHKRMIPGEATSWVGENPDGFIHYLDGRIEPFRIEKESNEQ